MKAYIKYIVLVIVVAVGFGIYMWNKPHDDMYSKTAEFTMQAAELLKPFQDNEAEANKKYNNRVIQVSGTILEVSTNDKGEKTVYLDAGDMMARIDCETDKFSPQPTVPFDKGQNVTFKGICTGFLSDVVLNRCVLVK